MSALQSGGGYVALPAGRGVLSDPVRVTASALASSGRFGARHVSREGSQAGNSRFSRELELNNRILRSLPNRDEPVGAGVVQVEGKLSRVVVFWGGSHNPEANCEPVTCADTINYLRKSVHP